jgi:hypothetical protein
LIYLKIGVRHVHHWVCAGSPSWMHCKLSAKFSKVSNLAAVRCYNVKCSISWVEKGLQRWLSQNEATYGGSDSATQYSLFLTL